MSGAAPIEIAPECERLGLRSRAVVFRNVKVAEAMPELRAQIADEATKVRARFADLQAVRAAPQVMAFEGILRAAGISPRKAQPSVLKLLSFALKRGTLPTINSLVDAYNLVSIRSLCSLGAHDLDCIRLPVSLRPLTGRETFTPLGQERPTPVRAGEFGYVDAAGQVLCWLDVVQADFSKVTETTTNVLLIIEATSAHAPQAHEQAYAWAIEQVTRHCGGTVDLPATGH